MTTRCGGEAVTDRMEHIVDLVMCAEEALRFPPYQDLGAERSEWLLAGAGFKIANDRPGGAKQSSL